MKRVFLVFVLLAIALPLHAGDFYLSNLSATKDSPLYTTYAAAKERSGFTLDEGYHLKFYNPDQGIDFTTDTAGDWGLAFKQDTKYVYELKEMYRQPVITLSYPDMVAYHYFPFESIRVDITFLVYNSRMAVQEITLRNLGKQTVTVQVIPLFHNRKGAFQDVQFLPKLNAVTFTHEEPPDSWTLEHDMPHVADVRDLILFSLPPEQINIDHRNQGSEVAAPINFSLLPGAESRLRVVRAIAPKSTDAQAMVAGARKLLSEDLAAYVTANEALYQKIPKPVFKNPDEAMLYWSAFTLLCQVMLPPEGKSHFNYYVFSREPTWGWGHGGQVFHESLSMLAYALMDPQSAMDSQRVYRERQHPDGYINYRTGAFLDETIPTNGQLTTSAPWYAWQNWEIYKITRDRAFLKEMYPSSKSFFNYYVKNRDRDRDGLSEWGADGVLESVRDSRVAVWDEVGSPEHFDALDLNTMLVQEAKALAEMATELGLKEEAKRWRRDAQARAEKINRLMWDEASGFYYSVDRINHTFTHKKPGDLMRQEIIGFLPLWAGIAPPDRAKRLVRVLTHPAKFWRPFGVPSLAADDPYYNPKGYWNGPVWVEWNYLIERGLLENGYPKEARELVERVAVGMIAQLKKDHSFWEFYSPDEPWAGYHKTYIWAGLIARMLLDTVSKN